MSDRLVIIIDDIDLVSVNRSYVPTHSSKNKTYLRRSEDLIKFQKDFLSKLESYSKDIELFKSINRNYYKGNLGINLNIIIILPKSVYYNKGNNSLRKYDTSNYIKSIEDELSRFLSIDDRYNVTVSATKCYNSDVNCNKSKLVLLIKCVNYNEYDSNKILDYYNI